MNLRKAGRINSLPPWVKAMEQHPPAPMPLKSVVPSEVGMFQPSNHDETVAKAQLANAYRIKRTPNSRLASIAYHKPLYTKKAPKIVYAEDEIRKVFYEWHPFELDRPRVIWDSQEQLGSLKWTDIHAGDAQVPLSGESVVQRTLYLMEQKSATKEDNVLHSSYSQALKEFYAAREQEELKELTARKMAEAAGASAEYEELKDIDSFSKSQKDAWDSYKTRPFASAFVRREEAELADSKEYKQMLQLEARSRRNIQKQTEAFSKT